VPQLLPDQTFYPSPAMAMKAPAETLAYVALLNPDPAAHDAIAVLDVDPASPGYGAQIARVEMPALNDELHHFGWNACSSCLCPYSPHPAHAAALPRRAGHALVADPHPRHEPDPKQPRLSR
jgi:selenium-binding protein 1